MSTFFYEETSRKNSCPSLWYFCLFFCFCRFVPKRQKQKIKDALLIIMKTVRASVFRCEPPQAKKLFSRFLTKLPWTEHPIPAPGKPHLSILSSKKTVLSPIRLPMEGRFRPSHRHYSWKRIMM